MECKRCKSLKIEQVNIILEFLYFKNFSFEKESKNIKNLYKFLSSEDFDKLKFIPTFNNNLESLQIYEQNDKVRYITKKELDSKNNFFQKRLLKELSQNNVVYFDILNLDEAPNHWKLIESNEKEKRSEKKENNLKTEEKILNNKDASPKNDTYND